MKRILILILILASFSFGQVTSLSSVFKLGRWTAGNKLNAGTIGDTAQSNASLNYNFDRLDALLGRQIDGNGYFTTLYGAGLGNLIIEARGSHAYRIVLNDSVYSTYDWQTTGNIVTGGNATIGGYVATDSIQLLSGTLFMQGGDITGVDDITGGSGSYFSASTIKGTDSIVSGIPTVSAGLLKLYTGSGLFEGRIVGGGVGVLTIPDQTGTIATIDGNQNFSNVGTIASEAITVSGRVTADSLTADNNYSIIYSDTKIAGTSAGDTSANFTTFLNTTNGNETKVRTMYVHRRGMANIKAYYQIKGAASTSVQVKIQLYSLAGALVATATEGSTAIASFAQDVATLQVTDLVTNQMYELRIVTSGSDVTDIPEMKNLTVIATSN